MERAGASTATSDELARLDAHWRAANYLSVGQIYLYDNPLLEKPLALKHIKPRLLGHWGTTPGLNFIYVHLNRVIKQHDLSGHPYRPQDAGAITPGVYGCDMSGARRGTLMTPSR